MAIVVDLQLGRSLLLPSAHTYNAVVELLDEARRGARDHPGDLAHLPAVRLPCRQRCQPSCHRVSKALGRQ